MHGSNKGAGRKPKLTAQSKKQQGVRKVKQRKVKKQPLHHRGIATITTTTKKSFQQFNLPPTSFNLANDPATVNPFTSSLLEAFEGSMLGPNGLTSPFGLLEHPLIQMRKRRFSQYRNKNSNYNSKSEALAKQISKKEPAAYKSNINLKPAAVISNPLKNKPKQEIEYLAEPLAPVLPTGREKILNPAAGINDSKKTTNTSSTGADDTTITSKSKTQKKTTKKKGDDADDDDDSEENGTSSTKSSKTNKSKQQKQEDGETDTEDVNSDDVDDVVDKIFKDEKAFQSYQISEVILEEVDGLEQDILAGVDIPIERVEEILDLAVEHDNPYAIIEIFRLLDPDSYQPETYDGAASRAPRALRKKVGQRDNQANSQAHAARDGFVPKVPPLNLNLYSHTLYACALTGNAQLAYHIYMMMALDPTTLHNSYSDETISRLLNLTLSPDLLSLDEVNNQLFNPYTDLCYDIARYLGADPQRIHQHFQQFEDNSGMGSADNLKFLNSPESKLYSHRLPQQFIPNPYANSSPIGLNIPPQFKEHLISKDEDEHFGIEAPAITSLATTFALLACIRAGQHSKPNPGVQKFYPFEKESPKEIDQTIRCIISKVLFHDTVRISPSHIALSVLGLYKLPYYHMKQIENVFMACHWRQLPLNPTMLFALMHVARESNQRLHLLMYFDQHFLPKQNQHNISFQTLVSSFRGIIETREQIFNQSKQWKHIKTSEIAQEWYDNLDDGAKQLYESDGGPYGVASRFGHMILPNFLATMAHATMGTSSGAKVRQFEVWARLLKDSTMSSSSSTTTNNTTSDDNYEHAFLPVFEEEDVLSPAIVDEQNQQNDDLDDNGISIYNDHLQGEAVAAIDDTTPYGYLKRPKRIITPQQREALVMKPEFYAFILALGTMRGLPYIAWGRTRDCAPTLWRESLMLTQLITNSTNQFDRYVFSTAIEASVNAGRYEAVLFLCQKLINMGQRVRVRMLDTVLNTLQNAQLTLKQSNLGLHDFNLQPQHKEIGGGVIRHQRPVAELPPGMSIVGNLIRSAMGEPVEYILHQKRLKYGLDTYYYKQQSYATESTDLATVDCNIDEYESDVDEVDNDAVQDCDPRYAKIVETALNKHKNRFITNNAVSSLFHLFLKNGHNTYAQGILGYVLGLDLPLEKYPSIQTLPEHLQHLVKNTATTTTTSNKSKLPAHKKSYQELLTTSTLTVSSPLHQQPLIPRNVAELIEIIQTPDMKMFLEEVRNAFLLTKDTLLTSPSDSTSESAQHFLDTFAYHPHVQKIPSKQMSTIVSQTLISTALHRPHLEYTDDNTSTQQQTDDKQFDNGNGNHLASRLIKLQKQMALQKKQQKQIQNQDDSNQSMIDSNQSMIDSKQQTAAEKEQLQAAMANLSLWIGAQVGPRPVVPTFIGHIAALVEIAHITNNKQLLQQLIERTTKDPLKHVDFEKLLSNETNQDDNNDNQDGNEADDDADADDEENNTEKKRTGGGRRRQRYKKSETLVFTHDLAKLEGKISTRLRHFKQSNFIQPELTIGGGDIVDRNNRVQLQHIYQLSLEAMINAELKLKQFSSQQQQEQDYYEDDEITGQQQQQQEDAITPQMYKDMLFKQQSGPLLMKLYNLAKLRFNWVDLTTSYAHLTIPSPSTTNTEATTTPTTKATTKTSKAKQQQETKQQTPSQYLATINNLNDYFAALPTNTSQLSSHGAYDGDESPYDSQLPITIEHNVQDMFNKPVTNTTTKTTPTTNNNNNTDEQTILTLIKNNALIVDLRQRTTTNATLGFVHAIQQIQALKKTKQQQITTFVIVPQSSHHVYAFPRTQLLTQGITNDYIEQHKFFETLLPNTKNNVIQKVFTSDEHQLDLYQITL